MKSIRNRLRGRIGYFLLIIAVIFCDMLTKKLAVAFLKPIGTVPLIEDVFHLTYAINTGAAFSMLPDGRWFFVVFTAVVLAAVLGYMLCAKRESRMLYAALALIAGGGAGNLVDRIKLGYVVDFFDFRLIDFAIFNVADACVTVGAVLFVLYLIVRREPAQPI